MADIDLDLRMRLMRARPELSLSHVDSLIRSIASDCLDIRDDTIAHGQAEQGDFFTFCYADGAALAAIFRKTAVEFFAFAADESFIHDAEHLAMVDIEKFIELARSRFHMPDERLVLPTSQVLGWMEQHRKAERDGDSKHVA